MSSPCENCGADIKVCQDCDIYSGKYAEQKKGRWKANDFHTCYCTNCNFAFDIMKCDFMDKMRFCPNCGANMEGGTK